MLRFVFVALGLLLLGGCDGPSGSGRYTANSPCTSTSTAIVYSHAGRRPGPCYDGTDITDRSNYDDTRNITKRVSDDTRDITPQVPDDVTDRTVWCEAAAQVIRAPSFMVFFDWDKSSLTPVALQTIQRAADAYKAKGGAQIVATGHTDTSGPDSYNMALSLRRANAVKDQLVHDGVAPGDISVIGRGEKKLLVPTADGVREAQNRRVEIVLRDDR
jgi:outer membrane protein OmpA-like peptidoglycan-associated protein